MRWYWECSHFKEELGNLVLCRMHGVRPAGGEPLDGFGVQLAPGMMENHLAALRNQRADYVAGHSDELARLESIAQAARLPPHQMAAGQRNGLR